jgi:hypothetical protein
MSRAASCEQARAPLSCSQRAHATSRHLQSVVVVEVDVDGRELRASASTATRLQPASTTQLQSAASTQHRHSASTTQLQSAAISRSCRSRCRGPRAASTREHRHSAAVSAQHSAAVSDHHPAALGSNQLHSSVVVVEVDVDGRELRARNTANQRPPPSCNQLQSAAIISRGCRS